MTLTARHEIESTVLTPSIRSKGRATRYWIITGIALVIVALVVIMLRGAGQGSTVSLSSTDASPGGSKALAQVLRSKGVTVTATAGMSATRDAANGANRGATSTTIFLVDDGGFLSADNLRELEQISSHLIVMTPNFDQLDALAPNIALAGNVKGKLSADCSLEPVQQAGTVSGGGAGYRLIGSDADAIECFDSGDNVHSLIDVQHAGNRLTVIGTREAFSNESVQLRGNAAFALGLLGEKPNLVWMMPTIADAPAAHGATIAELTPAWVSAVMAMLILCAVAAGFWRGRRFGPLVVESLPVIVRASETMRGRARLYEKSSAQLHALDALRMGTIDRLGSLCGLPLVASVDDVIRDVARVTGRKSELVARILRDELPGNEADLIRLSDSLLELESSTAKATRPSSATIDTTSTTQPKG